MDYCLNFGWYSQKCWQKNLILWWYSWNAKKKNWNHLVPRMGPRAYFRLRRAAAPAAGASRFHRGLRRCAAEAKNALGPILGTRWFQFILFLHFMKPPKYQIFCQHFCETTQNSNNNPWNQVPKKKMSGFLLKPEFDQNIVLVCMISSATDYRCPFLYCFLEILIV